MNKVFVIARREFLATVTRKGYIISLLGMPVFFALMVGIAAVAGKSADNSRKKNESGRIAVVDQAGVINFSLAEQLAARNNRDANSGLTKEMEKAIDPKPSFIAYPHLTSALKELGAGKLAACYLIEADYLHTGKIKVYTVESGFFKDIVVPGRGPLADLIRISLLSNKIPADSLDRILSPTQLTEMKVNKAGEASPASNQFQKMMSFFGPFAVALLLTISIFTSSGYLLQSTSEEKQNRVIEVILSSVKPDQLLAGKMLGLGGAGLLQVGFYILFLIVPTIITSTAFKISLLNMLISCSYFLLGFLLFSSIMASCGMIGNNLQESAQLSTVFTLSSMMPMMLMGVLMQAPDGTMARVFSFFPLTAPVMMLIRTGMGKPPVIDYVISWLVLIAAIAISIRMTAKIFRFASLMYGKRPTLPEIFRWFGAA